MKNKKLLQPALIVILLISSTGCRYFKPIWKCTYGETEPATGIVKIVSIEKSVYNGKTDYTISVNGFFSRVFSLSEEKYKSCIEAKGLKPGSSLKGYILSGGPCPPVFTIEGCD